MKKTLVLTIIITLLINCSPKITRMGYNENKNKTAQCDVIIKENATIDETMGKVIGEIKVGDTGFSTNCDEEKVMRILKEEACSIGADIINIKEIERPDLASSCYRVTAEFIKLNDSNMKGMIKSSEEFASEKIVERKKEDSKRNAGYIIGSVVIGALVGWLVSK
jgi:hypothetical protein